MFGFIKRRRHPPGTIVASTIQVATLLVDHKAAGVISGPVAALSEGIVKTMFLKKMMINNFTTKVN